MGLGIPCYLLFLLLFPCTSAAQSSGDGKGTVPVGAILTATEDSAPWLSSSGEFAFGFYKLEDRNDLFLLSIWYEKIRAKTFVWYANGDNPSTRDSKVELTSDRGLVLTAPNQSGETLISDPIIGTVAHGVMDDTGNFMLVNQNSEALWGSFNHSTDTILPAQILQSDSVLVSRKAEADFSQGRFQLSFRENGDLVLRTKNVPGAYLNEPYYVKGLGNNSGMSQQLNFNESGHLYISYSNGQNIVLAQVNDPRDFYHRATLNFDGVFTLYGYPKASAGNANASWTVLWLAPDQICLNIATAGSGVCGYNRICRLKEDRRPDCQCPHPFSLVNPADDYRGCLPSFIQGCGEGLYSAEDHALYTQTNIDWPTSDYELLQPYDEEKCKEACLDDCMCAVAILRDNRCWKKRLPLSNGRVDSSVKSKAFIKSRTTNSSSQGPGSSNQESRKNQDTLILLISVFLGGSVFANIILLGVICIAAFLFYNNKILRAQKADDASDRNLRCFTYKELEAATNGFREEVGRGSFGIVYKGVVKMSSITHIAVKKLDRAMRDGDLEFKTEVNVIGQTHHKNLVRLVGYCSEGTNRLLVYEFLSNGTLAGFLFGDLKLGWNQRVQIAIGIAKGLMYLHDECSTQIIHCDIKPQNILLDDEYNARISDFGLAKLLRMDQTETHTAIRGTKGYVAPEWFRNMPITVKVDVYSFGVLLLEIICCRRNVDMEVEEEKAILTYWAYDCYLERTLGALVEDDSEAMGDLKKVKRFLMVALWCLQEDPSLRPNMKLVVLMLEGIIEATAPPNPSPFSSIQAK